MAARSEGIAIARRLGMTYGEVGESLFTKLFVPIGVTLAGSR
jgi:hypothetical protein